MIAYLLKKLLSFSVTIMTLNVPQDKYQGELDNLPDIDLRMKGKNLQGWELKKVISSETGETHHFFDYPSTDKSAPVLLCLHGFNTDGSVFFKLKTLSDKYHLIAYNFPDRTKLYKGNIRDFDVLLNDFCSAAAIDSIDLLGYSVGGGIALSYAANAKKVNIKKIILISTTVFGTTPENQKHIRGMADKLLKYPDYKLYALLVRGAEVLRKMEMAEVKKNVPEDGVVIKHVDWYKEILKAFYWYEGRADVPSINCPVMVIHGKKDKLMNQKEIEATRTLFPKAKMVLLEDAAHSLVYSHPQEVDSILRKE